VVLRPAKIEKEDDIAPILFHTPFSMNAQQRHLANKAPELWAAINNKNLWLVRSTEIYNPMTMRELAYFSTEQYVNMHDILDKKAIFEIPQRALFNQSINLLVLPFTSSYIWDCRKYIFVAPMSEFVGELVGGTHQDFLTVGSHQYTAESYLLVPNDEVEKVHADFPNLKSTIVGYNYPKRLTGKETLSCTNELLHGEYNIKEETPRLAVENLFDRISRTKGIDIWRYPQQYYNSKLRAPKQHPSNSGNNQWSFRVDKNGKSINIDECLIKFNPLFKADEFSLEKLCGHIQLMKNTLRIKNSTTNNGSFLSDLIETETDCDKIPIALDKNYDIHAFKITRHLKEFKETQLDIVDKYSPIAKRYLSAIYTKSSNIICYLEVLHAYKKAHPQNLEYINSYLFAIDKPNNKLADVLLILVNKAEFQPLRNLIVKISNRINEDCAYELAHSYTDPEYLTLKAQFTTKINEIVNLLHIEVERIKSRNENLSDPVVKLKHNKNLIKARAKLTGGKKNRNNKTRKTKSLLRKRAL